MPQKYYSHFHVYKKQERVTCVKFVNDQLMLKYGYLLFNHARMAELIWMKFRTAIDSTPE